MEKRATRVLLYIESLLTLELMRTSLPKSRETRRLAVDFANIGRKEGAANGFPGWGQLIDYLQSNGIVSPERAEELLELPKADSSSANGLLRSAEELCLAIRDSFQARVHNEGLSRDSINTINRVLRITEGHEELVLRGETFRLEFVAAENGSEWLLAAIARSAAEILEEPAPSGLRVCSNPGCGLFFYDASPTRRRRWCSMAVCGNRQKVAAFARRRSSR